MTDIIKEMSQVTISDDLIKQINMNELLRKFKENYERLNKFKQTKDEYEQRGIGKKLWHAISYDNTMEHAQMDATEVQAEFSKILGQLTVVNIVLSKHLNIQQKQLSEQQVIIKKQTTQIESQTHELKTQQDILSKQTIDLNKLITESFELKGLTQEGAKKLIAIAKEIGNTRDILLKSVAESIGDLKEWVSSQHSEIDSKISMLENNVNDAQAKLLSNVRESQELLSKQQKKALDEVYLKIDTFEENVNENLLNAKNEYKSSITIFKQEQTKQNDEMINIRDNFIILTDNFKNLTDSFELYRNNERKKIQNLTIVFGVITIALSSVTGYLYLFAH